MILIIYNIPQVVTGSYEEFIRNEDFEQCSMQEFLKSYSEVEDRLIKNDDETYESYFSQLSLRSSECDALLKIVSK